MKVELALLETRTSISDQPIWVSSSKKILIFREKRWSHLWLKLNSTDGSHSGSAGILIKDLIPLSGLQVFRVSGKGEGVGAGTREVSCGHQCLCRPGLCQMPSLGVGRPGVQHREDSVTRFQCSRTQRQCGALGPKARRLILSCLGNLGAFLRYTRNLLLGLRYKCHRLGLALRIMH